jgi:hypothetical protein
VPYRDNPLPELLFFGPIQSGIEYIRTGKLRALVVTTAARSEILPDVPVLSDFVPGYEASAWLGLGAPRNTPADIVERLNRETNASLMSPEMKARFPRFGRYSVYQSAGRIWQAPRLRNREVGPGDPGGQHQGGLIGKFQPHVP